MSKLFEPKDEALRRGLSANGRLQSTKVAEAQDAMVAQTEELKKIFIAATLLRDMMKRGTKRQQPQEQAQAKIRRTMPAAGPNGNAAAANAGPNGNAAAANAGQNGNAGSRGGRRVKQKTRKQSRKQKQQKKSMKKQGRQQKSRKSVLNRRVRKVQKTQKKKASLKQNRRSTKQQQKRR